MHDPMTVAHEIKYPWFHYKPWPKKARRDPNPFELRHRWQQMSNSEKVGRSNHWSEGYRNTFITIWHVDPEKDGSDDSCGYSYPKITKAQRERLRNAAWPEGRNPHFLRCGNKEWDGTIADAECLKRGLILLVARVLRIHLTFDEAAKMASESTHIRDVSKVGDVFCFVPGYHTNRPENSDKDREEHFHGILCNVARNILDHKRPWWKHPKWHFWHWKFQCHPLGTFKRWAFSRCCKCGKRFTWGYSPVTNSWNSEGPRWFRGERDCYHSDCNRPADSCVVQAQTEAKNN